MHDHTTLRLDRAELISLTATSGLWQGFGQVRIDRTPMRNGARPILPEVRTADGWECGRWRQTGVREERGGVSLSFTPTGRRPVPMEWMLHTVRPREPASSWTADGWESCPPATLALDLQPVTRRVGGRTACGFSYRWSWRSDDLPIHRITDRATWEPGGSATGCTAWMRSAVCPSRAPFASIDDAWSTEWYLPGIANPSIFQFMPLQTSLQGFTCTSHAGGVLITWSPQVAHIRTLLEKPRGVDEIRHIHQLCGDLSASFDAAPIEVLYLPGAGSSPEDFANLYETVREMVADELHPQVGMAREYASTYCIAEEWGPADLARYRRDGIPAMAAAGAATVGLTNHFANNMNIYGVSNMCCTLDYRWPDGAACDAMRELVRSASAHGMQVQMWGNTSISTLTTMLAARNGDRSRIRHWQPDDGGIGEVLRRARHPFVQNPTGQVENDHYNPVFQLLNLRDPEIRGYWNSCWKAAHDETGISGMFLDSSFNLSSDKFTWRCHAGGTDNNATIDQLGQLGRTRPARPEAPAIESQYLAHLTLMAEMQRYGISYCGEDLGVFGTHRTGPGTTAKIGNLFMWNDTYAAWDGAAVAAAGEDPRRMFFAGLAYRQPWLLHWMPGSGRILLNPADGTAPDAEQIALLTAMRSVAPRMRNRTLLPDGAGVAYRPAGGGWLVWAMRDGCPLPEGPVIDVLSGRSATGPARALRIYAGGDTAA